MRWATLVMLGLTVGCSLLVGDDPGEDSGNCPVPDDDTLVTLSFEDAVLDTGAVLENSAGDLDATIFALGIEDEPGALELVEGPPGCGQAVYFPADNDSAAFIPDDAIWELSEGSVEFWMKLDRSTPKHMGVVTRDANGQEFPGHFGVSLGNQNTEVSAVLQETGVVEYGRCFSPDLQTNRWIHVGVNFGPPDLEVFVDDQRGEGPCPDALGLAEATTRGITGNSNPWVIGADSGTSFTDTHEGSERPLQGVAIDHVRISRIRRTF